MLWAKQDSFILSLQMWENNSISFAVIHKSLSAWLSRTPWYNSAASEAACVIFFRICTVPYQHRVLSAFLSAARAELFP